MAAFEVALRRLEKAHESALIIVPRKSERIGAGWYHQNYTAGGAIPLNKLFNLNHRRQKKTVEFIETRGYYYDPQREAFVNGTANQ